MKKVNFTYRKCRKGWHLDDARGYAGICSYCILKLNHPTLRKFNDLLSRIHRGRKEHLSNLSPKAVGMPMRQQRLRADYRQAAALLRDDLVWSGDFDNIRFDLMELIENAANTYNFQPALTEIVQKLISDENDLSI